MLNEISEFVGRIPVLNRVVSTALWIPERIMTGRMLYMELARGVKPSDYQVERLRSLRGLVRLAQGAEFRPYFEIDRDRFSLGRLKRR